MKKTWWLIPCLIVVLALGAVGCVPSGGGPGTISISPQQNTGIWVTGQGEVMAVPDIAELSLGIEARADTVDEAQTQASEAMHKVMEALKDNGVDEKDIQTQRFSIYPVTKWIKDEDKEEIIGYRVTNMVVAKIREVDKAGVIIDAVAKAGGDLTRIQGINFSVDDPEPYYEQARDKALKDAKNKATQLADLAGVKLGKPTYISEGTVYVPRVSGNFLEKTGAPAPAPPPISPGELKITLNVQVAYEIM
ncbi:MAG: SIMPL domain-containing protein [Chloroflexota bacterium]|nr:SIMPL domain-containing protein [Chloroflexota bacterium]